MEYKDKVFNQLKEGKPDPYYVCPVYESKNFLLRLVSIEDAEYLLECYSNPNSQQIFNTDNYTYGYADAYTIEKMEHNILLWIKEYKEKNFVRFSIIDKKDNKAVGTIEIFNGGENGRSVLRLDILPKFENIKNLRELIVISDLFFYDFGCKNIVTKAIPLAKERIEALRENGYNPYPKSESWNRDDYFIKTNKKF